jgi:L-serine dehydratase
MLEYRSVAELIKLAEERNAAISDVVLADQAEETGMSPGDILERMRGYLGVMRDAVGHGAEKDLRSPSGLTGGAGALMAHYRARGKTLSGAFCSDAIAKALAAAEYNAAMGKIVAAPTAGSCGILSAAVLAMEESGAALGSAEAALVTAGGIGLVIANEASISGAEGGCQAECGSAAAMAAAALVEMAGGTPAMAGHACAIALKNSLGLVCDPVAGLVEVPCVKRNAGGVMNAVCAADMALAGIASVIPVDEMISAMREVGERMPERFRETAEGGCAATPTAVALRQRIFGQPA